MCWAKDHTFVLCAYGESPYLSDCLDSLVNQSTRSNILISTSTPNSYIDRIASNYSIPVIVNEGSPSISHDWNCAIANSNTKLVTIAHQDDIYSSSYTETMLRAMKEADRPLIFFSNYGEIRNGVYEENLLILKIKRILLRKFARHAALSSVKDKRDILRFGSAICCPSVTFNLSILQTPLFMTDMKCDLDWEAWERFSKIDGSFVYSPEVLMFHRIHEGSETTALIKDDTRRSEDETMLQKFWPKWFAPIVCSLYSLSMRSNSL